MKSKRNIAIKYTILVLLIGYVAYIGVWAHREADKQVCTGIIINVKGGKQLTEMVQNGVSDELNKYPKRITGAQIHQVNTADIERFLSKSNNFESVHCIISSRGELVVNIVPLIPVMRVFFGDNSYYINKEGRHIVSNAEFFSDVPVVTGRFSRTFPPKDVLPLINYINKDQMLKDLVSMVNAHDKNNLILVPRIKGHVINFGDTTRLDEKKRALALFYRQVMPYKGWEEYDTISVKFRGQIVATRRDKSRLNHSEEYVEDVDLEEATLPDGGTGGSTTTAEKKDSVG